MCVYKTNLVTGSKDCKINSLDVSNCAADATSCDFTRGDTINMTLKFTTTTSLLCNSYVHYNCCIQHNV